MSVVISGARCATARPDPPTPAGTTIGWENPAAPSPANAIETRSPVAGSSR